MSICMSKRETNPTQLVNCEELLQQDNDLPLKVMNSFWHTYYLQGLAALESNKDLMATIALLYFRLTSKACFQMVVCTSQVTHNLRLTSDWRLYI